MLVKENPWGTKAFAKLVSVFVKLGRFLPHWEETIPFPRALTMPAHAQRNQAGMVKEQHVAWALIDGWG